MHDKGSVWGGALLVAGTSIGGGMLALPVLTSVAGFLPSVLIYLLCWLFMASTGLLFLEVSQGMKEGANLISMAHSTLGEMGRFGAWLLYLFLFYCLTIAYMVGCGNIFIEVFSLSVPDYFGPILTSLLFFPLILISTKSISRLNIFLVGALALSYFGFVFLGARFIDFERLHFRDWTSSLRVLPIAFTSFAYQGIIPTLASFMHYDTTRIRKSILIGSFIPFVAYIIWEGLILGIVPIEGANGLKQALALGQNAVYPLKFFLYHDFVYWLGQSFAFFALITSFIGVALGLRDFLADGLSIEKKGKGLLLLALLVLLPPLIVAVSHPHIFLTALDYAGGFGCALLLGLLPIVMAWKKRKDPSFAAKAPLLPGGKALLFLLALFVFFELLSESWQLLWRLF